MESHYDLSDDQFEMQFQTAKLPTSLFNHEAHVRLAWIHIKKYGCEIAIENITSQIMAYVIAIGETEKYNMTLTVAAVKAVNHFMQKSSSNNFPDFIAEFPRLNTNFRELIALHYKMDIYHSAIAKREYVEPDLLPFT